MKQVMGYFVPSKPWKQSGRSRHTVILTDSFVMYAVGLGMWPRNTSRKLSVHSFDMTAQSDSMFKFSFAYFTGESCPYKCINGITNGTVYLEVLQ